MKYYKICVFALAFMFMTSCAKHDLMGDNAELGQMLPTVTWELSTVCTAGEDMPFKVKYYAAPGYEISHSEVWASVTRQESASAVVKLTSSLAYNKTFNLSDTVRRSQLIKSYPHSEAQLVGKEYVLNTSFPTSATLAPVSWVSPNDWDEVKFDTYFPKDFKEEFVATVIDYLTKDSLYYNDLRHVYVNYDFKKEQFEELNTKYNINFPTEIETADKSDLWFTNIEKVVGKYYITIENGVSVYHEIPLGQDPPGGVSVYDVYDSSFWVFCRYSDDTGMPMYSVRPEYMPYLKDLISYISFPEWVYDSADKVYTVSFSRTYSLIPTIKVFDAAGKAGTDTDKKEINLK